MLTRGNGGAKAGSKEPSHLIYIAKTALYSIIGNDGVSSSILLGGTIPGADLHRCEGLA
jgi:hypothetical protein